MGGYGSGRSHGDEVKGTTSRYPALNVRRLQKDGLLKPGQTFPYTLTRFGRAVASIGLEVTESQIILSYDYLKTGEVPRSERYNVPVSVEWASCNYGGRRAWLRCPASGCGRRVAILYGKGLFACRHCHQLVYYSQRSTDSNRALRRAQEIRERLGGTANMFEPFPEKPKGMHFRTYLRLFREHQKADAASWSSWFVSRAKSKLDKGQPKPST